MADTIAGRVSNPALIRERHAHLVGTATDLFLAKGFHKTTVREIANAAGWQMGTLYLYISRKEDVLFLISQAIMDELSEGLLRIPVEGPARDVLGRAMDYFFEAVRRMRKEVALLYRESPSLLPEHLDQLKNSELVEREFFARIVERGVASGEFRPVDTNLFCHDIIMMAHMWALKGWTLAREYTFEEYKQKQMDLLWRQLLP